RARPGRGTMGGRRRLSQDRRARQEGAQARRRIESKFLQRLCGAMVDADRIRFALARAELVCKSGLAAQRIINDTPRVCPELLDSCGCFFIATLGFPARLPSRGGAASCTPTTTPSRP